MAIVRLGAGSYSLDVQVLRRCGDRGRSGWAGTGTGTGHDPAPGDHMSRRREGDREAEGDEADERQPAPEPGRDEDVLEVGAEIDHLLRAVRAHRLERREREDARREAE